MLVDVWKIYISAREIDQKLRTLTAFIENTNAVSSTHVCHITSFTTPAPGHLVLSSGHFECPTHDPNWKRGIRLGWEV